MRILRRPRFPDAVQRLDVEAFRRVSSVRASMADSGWRRLSRSADHGRLWLALSVALWLSGRRYGRRAGLRGLLSLAITSFLANVPAKLLWARQRPDIELVPAVRRLARIPTSPSFPSGHAASAFAFATGVAMEEPMLAPPAYALAAGVAYSRVHTGVHYPSDVLAGALLGTVTAVATRRLWGVGPAEPAKARRTYVDLEQRPEPKGGGLVVAVNESAGNGLADPLERIAADLPDAEVTETDGGGLADALGEAAERACALGVCGGDGSVNAAADVALDAGKPLVVFPGGTLNHFTRDLGIETIADAIEAVQDGEAVAVDVGRIAGRPFLNTASLGAYVDLVDARERLEDRIGKWPAMMVALVRVLRTSSPAHIELDGETIRTWMVFVGNGRYEPDGMAPTYRTQLDDGELDIRLVDASRPMARMRLVLGVLTGTLTRCAPWRCIRTSGPVEVRSLDGPLRLARDGETFDGPATFRIEKSERRLTVLVPRNRD